MRIGPAPSFGRARERGVQRRRWAPARPDRSASQSGVACSRGRANDVAPTAAGPSRPAALTSRIPRPDTRPQYPSTTAALHETPCTAGAIHTRPRFGCLAGTAHAPPAAGSARPAPGSPASPPTASHGGDAPTAVPAMLEGERDDVAAQRRLVVRGGRRLAARAGRRCPRTRHARRSETPCSATTRSMPARRRTGLTGLPRPPPSGSARPA
jgi:hypothetical protein